MQVSRLVILIVAWGALLFTATQGAYAQVGTDHITINIPKKIESSSTSIVPIGEVKAVVSLSNGSPVTFTFSDQTTPTAQQMSIGPIGPGSSAQSVTFLREDSSALGGDIVTVTPPSGSIPANDPARFRYEIDIQLKSNFDANCVNKQIVDPNFYKVQITPTSTAITAVCVESFDGHPRPTGLNSCTNTNPSNPNFALYEAPIPLDNSADTVATATLNPDTAPVPQPTFACSRNSRPPIDVVMVLDKSGSMNSTTNSGIGCSPSPCTGLRIEALRSSVKNLVNLWSTLPTAPPLPPPASAPTPDKVGVVLFDSTACYWSALHPGATCPFTTPPPLVNLTDPSVANAFSDTNLNTITPGSSTSIGDGLFKAAPALPPQAGHRKVIVLMSDGQQNTNPLVDSSTVFPNSPQIYTVTLGPSTSVDPAVNQAIANARLGFYLNTEDHADLLGPFFLELLQNFLKFNSYDTVRLISDNTPYTAEIPISTTSQDVEFSLMWPKNAGPLRLTVIPPGGAQPLVEESESGFISIIKTLPLPAPFDPNGDWKVSIESPRHALNLSMATGGSGIGFDFHVMTDDAGIKSDLAVVPGDYKPGDNIRLRAKLTYFGLPIAGLGPNAGRLVKVDLIKPGQSVGDMLSDSAASPNPPASNPDLHPGAEAKLFNALQGNPSALKHDEQKGIPLFDDGKPEHGDDLAGDGIYSALYPAILPGHYNFLFSAESTDPNSVRFSRQQLRTAYVRAVPDAGNTVFQSSVLGNVLSIVMTPRVKPGPGCAQSNPKCGRMGPGWANYFWFTTPGQTPFKAIDNLNGTYTATLSFTGSNPPPVSVHFENVLAVIGDSVTPDHLPAPLGPATIFEKDCCKLGGKFAAFFDLGPNFPHGAFGTIFNTGVSLNAGLEYILQPHLSLEGIFGYHHFPGSILGDLNVYQFSVNGKTYLTNGTIRPFVNGGIGGYKLSPGSTYFGGNFGGGVLFNVTSHFGLQGSYNFHVVNTTGAATKHSSVQLGLRLVR